MVLLPLSGAQPMVGALQGISEVRCLWGKGWCMCGRATRRLRVGASPNELFCSRVRMKGDPMRQTLGKLSLQVIGALAIASPAWAGSAAAAPTERTA